MFCSPFPTVAEAVQEELEDYKTKEDEVRRLKRAMVTILIFTRAGIIFPLCMNYTVSQ